MVITIQAKMFLVQDLFINLSLVFAALHIIKTVNSENFYELKNKHQPKSLNDQDVTGFASLTDMDHFKFALSQILVPRVVGTPEHKQVGDFIVNSLKDLDWNVEQQTFVDYTPTFGNLKFRNIIATLNPNADRYLVLACHYDSKYTREHVFLGATDSAVPCTMLLNMAKTMAPLLVNTKRDSPSLMFIFFDGEEAFRQWGPKDSIYGARYMAKKWQQTPYKNVNQLKRMDMMVLLDLLGAPDPVFSSYFQATERWYAQLADAEYRLAQLKLLEGYSYGKAEQTYFRLRSSGSFIEDDHIPFLKRNVDILHVIPTPFPECWHKPCDNMQALDFNTIENLNKIFRIFVAEYLHLDL